MAQHYSSCGEFIAAGAGALPVYMFEKDFERIKDWVLNYPNLETGGDLFGLWTSSRRDLRPLIHIVLGPGEGCKRTEYSFFQDVPYLKHVGNTLTNTFMLGHIGEWHSHHSLSLFEPSIGDYNTVKRNYPQGFHGFLLLIANISPNSEVVLSPYMFRQGASQIERCSVRLLAGESPFRRQGAIKGAIERGTEVATRGRQPAGPAVQVRPDIARVTAAGTGQSWDTAAVPKYKSTPYTSCQERPKHGNPRVSETTKPETGQTTQPGTRPLPPAPVVQWYSTKNGKAELQRIQQSFQRLDGVKSVSMYHDSKENLCFKIERKSLLWNVQCSSNYPRGTTVLKCSPQSSNTVLHIVRIQGTDCYSATMTTIINKMDSIAQKGLH